MTTIYIIGPRCAGKTTVGSILAQKLGFRFRDMDLEFYKKYGAIGKHIKDDLKEYLRKQFVIIKQISMPATVASLGASSLLGEDYELDMDKISYCKTNGKLVLLLSHDDFLEGAKTSYARCQVRPYEIFGPELLDEDMDIYLEKYEAWMKYKNIADAIVIEKEPEKWADEIIKKLKL